MTQFKSVFMKHALLIFLSSLLLLPCLAEAAVNKKIPISTSPSGVDVYLKKGTREILLGRTPFTYEAKFHSDQSIIRLLFRKKGLNDKVLKIKASDNKISLNLSAFQFSADPALHKDKNLKSVQKNINPVIDREMPILSKSDGRFQYHVGNALKAVKISGKTYLSIPIVLEKFDGKFNTRGKERQEELLEELWGQFGEQIVLPLGQKLTNYPDLAGIKLDIYFDEKKFLFNVSSRVETSIEMECVPGTVMRNVYNACARQRIEYYTDSSGFSHSRNAGCEGGYVMQSVYDPCASKVPVTKSKLVIDPKTGIARGKAVATFNLSSKYFSKKHFPFSKVSYKLVDANGKILKSN